MLPTEPLLLLPPSRTTTFRNVETFFLPVTFSPEYVITTRSFLIVKNTRLVLLLLVLWKRREVVGSSSKNVQTLSLSLDYDGAIMSVKKERGEKRRRDA